MHARWSGTIVVASIAALAGLGLATVACSDRAGASAPPVAIVDAGAPAVIGSTVPMAPGAFAPSLMKLAGAMPAGFGDTLTDVDTCATCHPAVAAQWSSSAHSFASFGNPIYRQNVEELRAALGKPASQHCGGCHDIPLQVDGAMLGEVPPEDLRAHSGVTCRTCHGITAVTSDGNGSYTLSTTPLYTPDTNDAASIERHRRAVSVKALGAELCVGCHRGFISPDLGLPAHISGLDEPLAWRNSPYTGNGMGRVDKVDKQTCLDCHMAQEEAGADEVAAHDGHVASHRFLGAHTWMAAMRGDTDQLARTQAKLRGVASIDVSGLITLAPPPARRHGRAVATATPPADPATSGLRTAEGTWTLPADGAPIAAGQHVALAVVVRNLLVGHRFPGGVMDMQDTWIEVEVHDARGRLLGASGTKHARDPKDDEAHVLRSLPVDGDGQINEQHQLAKFRAVIAAQTIAPRDAAIIRYAFDVPAVLDAAALPLRVDARLRHRSRSLAVQAVVCASSKTPIGRAFKRGANGARGVVIDPCPPQPITEIASTTVWLGDGARAAATAAGQVSTRPAWERAYELGMALTGEVQEHLEDARVVLEAAQAMIPAGDGAARPRAMVLVQLAKVASTQDRMDDALALIAQARALLPAPGPAVFDAVEADARVRVWQWQDAIAPARAATTKAPGNTVAWVTLARVLASAGDDAGALAAARAGLALTPRDADLLRSQATALRALGSPDADAALAAYDRFRQPDDTGSLRITCAQRSAVCARERELGHVHVLVAP